MSGARHWEQDKEATVYVGNLDERATDALVWELMLQAGRIVNVHLPKDRVTQTHQGYGFVEFQTEEDAEYAAKIMNQVRLYGKPIRVNKASADKAKIIEIGAQLFVGNLDPMVDEKALYDTFSRFGALTEAPKVARDEANLSKGYGFVSFSNFESSDEAIANMHGQYLMNQEISVQYAFKKDGKGLKHGDDAERMLANQARAHNVELPVQPIQTQLFAPPIMQQPMPAMNDSRGPAGFAPPGFANGHQQHQGPPRGGPSPSPLPPPPSGLPARPPPSVAGYGGPANFAPPGFSGGQYPQGGPPPMGAPGMGGPPGAFPPGFAPGMPGAPPPMPPGFQQQYQR
ncbi:RNA-binding domain-containing protein [Microthyrium microscopicum]|uniref:RNA-binding domain-containing protein n=1 Tax=Microthyrium microscopicum TaxID=703497 RepID=A0A6A6U3I3_9PEZI|nr:RNA-binding domain-containing protein [Microthyrium microscopicum]